MQAARTRLDLPSGGGALEVIRYGHWGRPVLLFPSEGGSAVDAAGNGMLAACSELIESGRMSLFCADSMDGATWSDQSIPTEERALRHGVYHRWLVEAAVPWIVEQGGGAGEIITTGVSLGAYHAVHFALQRADLAPLAIGLSGNYDPTSWNGWGELGDASYFANPAAYVRNMEGDHLEWIRSRLSIVLVVGQGPFEVSPTRSLAATTEFAATLQEKGIRHELDVWGFDSAHDWPWWQRQLAHHLPRFV